MNVVVADFCQKFFSLFYFLDLPENEMKYLWLF